METEAETREQILKTQFGFLLDAKLSLDAITSKLIQARSAL